MTQCGEKIFPPLKGNPTEFTHLCLFTGRSASRLQRELCEVNNLPEVMSLESDETTISFKKNN